MVIHKVRLQTRPTIMRNRLAVCRIVFHSRIVMNEAPLAVNDKRVAIPVFPPLDADVAPDKYRKLVPISA